MRKNNSWPCQGANLQPQKTSQAMSKRNFFSGAHGPGGRFPRYRARLDLGELLPRGEWFGQVDIEHDCYGNKQIWVSNNSISAKGIDFGGELKFTSNTGVGREGSLVPARSRRLMIVSLPLQPLIPIAMHHIFARL